MAVPSAKMPITMASGVVSTILARLDPSLLSEQVLWRELAAMGMRARE